MYAKRIIPCLDIKNGRVVKGTSFVNLRDAGDPVQCAVEYDRQGADELVLLDITASSDARSIITDNMISNQKYGFRMVSPIQKHERTHSQYSMMQYTMTIM